MLSYSANYMLTAVLGTALSFASPAQSQSESLPEQQSFASENAVLDTSIPFALGAREARQELRGAFGWPTFQEGLVEGVYFRFDPDGYARFAPTPRLDADVFEVICRPRTHVCMGRKSVLAMTLNARGQIQLELQNISDGDRFFVEDGVTELPLPAVITQPLDTRLELLLSSGGDLVVKRGDAEVERVSLLGFAAVAAYLRWVSAKQDYIVLPRGWPVPNATNTGSVAGLTQVSDWQSPMPQPHRFGQTSIATAQQQSQLLQEEVAGFQGAVAQLQDLLTQNEQTVENEENTVEQDEIKHLLETLLNRFAEFESTNSKMGMLQGPGVDMYTDDPQQTLALAQVDKKETIQAASLSDRLEYLIEEIGLQPELALLLVQYSQHDETAVQTRRDAVTGLVEDLRGQMSEDVQVDQIVTQSSDAEYQLLSDYFKSAQQGS